jgi:pimeloyl-ACP methyl ester carboxylesterase
LTAQKNGFGKKYRDLFPGVLSPPPATLAEAGATRILIQSSGGPFMNKLSSSCKHSHPNIGSCQMLEVAGTIVHVISEGTGPVVLFVHGSQAWSYAWRYQIQTFVAAGYQAVALD